VAKTWKGLEKKGKVERSGGREGRRKNGGGGMKRGIDEREGSGRVKKGEERRRVAG